MRKLKPSFKKTNKRHFHLETVNRRNVYQEKRICSLHLLTRRKFLINSLGWALRKL